MKRRLLYILTAILAVLPLLGGCSGVDDDFFQGKTWYIVGLCVNRNTNELTQKGTDGKLTALAQEWQNEVKNSSEARYYIQFGEKGAFTIQTERHTWRGTFTYDLESRKVSFTFTNRQASTTLENKMLEYLTDVVSYSGNNRYMELDRNNGGFVWLEPAPEGRALFTNQ